MIDEQSKDIEEMQLEFQNAANLMNEKNNQMNDKFK